MNSDVILHHDGMVATLECRPGWNKDTGWCYNVRIYTQRAWENSLKHWNWNLLGHGAPRWPLLAKSFGNKDMAEDFLLDKMTYTSFLLLSMT